MKANTVEASTTFVPWYAGRLLVSPYDGKNKDYQRRERAKRVDLIRANIAASPSRSMFYREDVAA
jgi:hypothetical protein